MEYYFNNNVNEVLSDEGGLSMTSEFTTSSRATIVAENKSPKKSQKLAISFIATSNLLFLFTKVKKKKKKVSGLPGYRENLISDIRFSN